MPDLANLRPAFIWSEVRSMIHALAKSDQRQALMLVSLGLVTVVGANTIGQIRLNAWNQGFYDAVAQKHFAAFLDQIGIFGLIAASLLVLGVMQTWLHETLKVTLREALTRTLIREWMQPGRVYRLSLAGDIGVNVDQRIHEDVRHLTELCADLGVGLLQSSLLLISFISVLWGLSGEMAQSSSSSLMAVPGYMVWCALAYALISTWMSWYVGRPLIDLNVERSAKEAGLRFALVRVSEAAEAISLFHGEADERRRLDREVSQVVEVTKRIVNGLARLTWITAGSGWVAIVVPFIVAAPGYFTGDLSFGSLMMTVAAFMQVHQSLRWFVDNFSRLADWSAALLRVMRLREALIALGALSEDAQRIDFREGAEEKLIFDKLGVLLFRGKALLAEPHVEIGPGEHVVIVGDPSSGKSALFKALAGLWPWGTGSVLLPHGQSIMFMPQRPYLPPGSLRAILAYPASPDKFGSDAFAAALDRVGLGHLKSDLEREERWDRLLSLEEQQRLAVARLMLHRPRWIIFDEAISALDEDSRRLVLSIFENELGGVTVISTSRRPPGGKFYERTLHLVRDREGALTLSSQPRPNAPWPPRPERPVQSGA